uniref:Uncharacterized protein n=1 Tax=Rhizophora mucronata TaxID=61149 RepID=A0A2P2MZY6_RHIMU
MTFSQYHSINKIVCRGYKAHKTMNLEQ